MMRRHNRRRNGSLGEYCVSPELAPIQGAKSPALCNKVVVTVRPRRHSTVGPFRRRY
jgi:hypothetical protein